MITFIGKENVWYHVKGTDLTTKAKPGRKVEVTYAVSYDYNGGTVIDGKWYVGYEVDPPIVPKGYVLKSLGVGLECNCRPPRATAVLMPENLAKG